MHSADNETKHGEGIMDLWFTENLEIVEGWRQQIRIARTIHSETSSFQSIDILETTNCGRMLVLDNVVMCTEFDEFSYHEMIVHTPLFAHPCPKKVLVIGGGDGGSVREALKHPSVEEVHLCEIDRRVVELCREFIPSMAGALGDPRVKIFYEDGVEFVRKFPNSYDVIVVDSTDPVGMAKALFDFDFYESSRDALREDGILINQAENFMFHADIIRKLLSFGRKLFPVYRYYFAIVPTYPGGMIGFTFFSRKHSPFEFVAEKVSDPARVALLDSLRYWSADIHQAAFALPASVKKKLGI